MEYFLLIYVAIGAIAGVLAGLLGVGGGLVIVPALLVAFHLEQVSDVVAMHLAIGTSLATIILTSISSLYAHHRRGAVAWSTFRCLTPGVVIGTLIGAVVAKWLPGATLRTFFAVFELLVAVQMWFGWRPSAQSERASMQAPNAAGAVIGMVSSLVGIGGGTMTVPYLVWQNMDLRRAIATSAAVGLPIALGGTVGFTLAGWNAAGLPPMSAGYVYLPAFAAIGVASLVFAPFGAYLTHRLPVPTLRRLFAVIIAGLGIELLWLG